MRKLGSISATSESRTTGYLDKSESSINVRENGSGEQGKRPGERGKAECRIGGGQPCRKQCRESDEVGLFFLKSIV